MESRNEAKANQNSPNHKQSIQSLKIKTRTKAGGLNLNNHNQSIRPLKVKTHVKAGGLSFNHNQTTVRAR